MNFELYWRQSECSEHWECSVTSILVYVMNGQFKASTTNKLFNESSHICQVSLILTRLKHFKSERQSKKPTNKYDFSTTPLPLFGGSDRSPWRCRQNRADNLYNIIAHSSKFLPVTNGKRQSLQAPIVNPISCTICPEISRHPFPLTEKV